MFWVEPEWLSAAAETSTGTLGGAAGHHAATVRRIGSGELVQLADGSGRRAMAEVLSAGPGELSVKILDVVEEPMPAQALVLVQALAKGGRDEQAIEAATELGVDRIYPWGAAHCVVQWSGPKAVKGQAKWQSVVDTAAKQARRVRVPLVHEIISTKGLVLQIAQAKARGAEVFLADAAGVPLIWDAELRERCTHAPEIWILVGPEGGVSPAESESLCEAGGDLINLGPTVLRSAHAGPAALAVLASGLRW